MAVTTNIPPSAAPTASVGVRERLTAALARLSNQQKIVLIVALAAVVTLVVASILLNRDSDYKVLFSNLSERDGGAIITALEQLQVPHKFSESSGAILVPSDRVHEVRLRLASQGLPKGGAIGFELMENQKFGISQFAEQVNYQRGLEGELSRTIQAIAAVQTARVHLAIPKPSVFVRDEQKPTASVMLQLYPGRALEPAQVAGITHLVASSVPHMPPANVAIIDQNGNLVSQLKSKLIDAGLDPTQLKYIQEVEASVIKRIDDILAPITGPGNTRVQVAADVDFSETEQTAESYRPNNSPTEATVRSQQSSESAAGGANAGGVPGALSNQPPVPATAPLTSPAAPGAAGAQNAPPVPGKISAAGITATVSSIGQPINTRKDSTVNYEVDKTIKHVKSSLGAVKRLSVAVVVNYKKESGKDGKSANKPLSEAEIKQINDLVKEAMGYTKDRGDTLSVVNSPFSLVEKVEPELPVWKDPGNIALAKELVRYAVIGAIVLYLLLGVVRPLVRQMFPPPPPPAPEPHPVALAEEPEAQTDDEVNMAIASYEHKLSKARQIATEDPTVVANIIKDWIKPNA